LPAEQKDAFYQLVHYPVAASANLNELYMVSAKNKLYSKQARNSTNRYADKVVELYKNDSLLTGFYHSKISNGKWNHMMSQTHIGYTNWQQPDKNSMPEINTIQNDKKPLMGVAVEFSDKWYPQTTDTLELPIFDPINNQIYSIEIFNRGSDKFNFSIVSPKDWIKFSASMGEVESDRKLNINIDWTKAPVGLSKAPVAIQGPNQQMAYISIITNNKNYKADGFVENNGIIAIDAPGFSKVVSTESVNWQIIPNLGRTESAITVIPVTSSRQTISENSPRLEYPIYVFDTGKVNISCYLSPTLNFQKTEGILYAISIDDEEPQIVNIHLGDTVPDWKYPAWWVNSVGENIRKQISFHQIATPGKHTIKFWMVDPGIVLQRIVLEYPGFYRYSYLGPPESLYINE
jgi:hypothetical protein